MHCCWNGDKMARQNLTYLHWITIGEFPLFCCDFCTSWSNFKTLCAFVGTRLFSHVKCWKWCTVCCFWNKKGRGSTNCYLTAPAHKRCLWRSLFNFFPYFKGIRITNALALRTDSPYHPIMQAGPILYESMHEFLRLPFVLKLQEFLEECCQEDA